MNAPDARQVMVPPDAPAKDAPAGDAPNPPISGGSSAGAATLSAFWRRVAGHGDRTRLSDALTPLPVPAARGLGTATRAAWARSGTGSAFRRNRELADLQGRFRRFTVAGAPHVAKVLDPRAAAAERARAEEADRLLRHSALALTAAVPEPVAIDPDRTALVLPDLGRTLAEHPLTPPPAGAVHALLDGLLAAGIVWRGFAPRNICPAPLAEDSPGRDAADAFAGCTLLDLECVTFLDAGHTGPRPGIDPLTVQFWALEWCPPGGDPAEQEAGFLDVLRRHGLTTAAGPADSYEQRFAALMGLPVAAARRRCGEVTVEAWRPIDTALWNGRCFTASEMCQLFDELLPVDHAIVATCTLAAARADLGESGYADLLARLEHAVIAAVAAAGGASQVRPDLARIRTAVDASAAALLVRSLPSAQAEANPHADLDPYETTDPRTGPHPDPDATPRDHWSTLLRLARSRYDSRRRDSHRVV